MLYKKINLFILLIILISSCETNNNREKIQNESILEKKPNDSLGIIPKNHDIYNTKGYNELFSIYRDIKKKDKAKHYYQNLCNSTIFKIFQSDFYKNSDAKDRDFLMNELISLEYTLPNIENFYDLVNFMLNTDEIKIEEAKLLAKKFANKNTIEIKNTLNSNPELKQNKLKAIDKGQSDILRYERQKLLQRLSQNH